MIPWKALLIIGGIYMLTKKQADDYPNKTHASPHFRWDELIVSASYPEETAMYRAKYPDGAWPYFLDESIWTPSPRYTFQDAKAIAKTMYPHLLERPISSNMVQHLNNLVEPLRAHLGGKPLAVLSAWRGPEVNISGNMARSSGHLMGVATDLQADQATANKAREWALANRSKVGFFKIYPWGFHIGSPRNDRDHVIK